jgi:predicted RecB family nuclease
MRKLSVVSGAVRTNLSGRFPNALDLHEGTPEERRHKTVSAINSGAPVIYQAFFSALARLNGHDCEVVGSPDFLVREDGNYVIHDVKIARRITNSAHPAILWQLQSICMAF